MGVNVREKIKGSGVWWIFIKHQGRRRSKKIGKDKRLAIQVAKKIEARLVLGDCGFVSSVPTFKEYSNHFMSGYSKHNHKESTQAVYQKALDKHLLKEFGPKRLDQITRRDVKVFIFKKRKEGLAHRTVLTLMGILGSILSQAMDDELIDKNPVSKIGKHIKTSNNIEVKREEPLTWEEKNILEAAVKEHFPRDYTLLLTELRTGLRISELVALRPEDLDFEGMFINVERSYDRERKKITSTKSNTRRKVDMSPQLASVLKEYLLARKKEALEKGWGKPPDWLFYTEAGKIMDRTVINHVMLKSWLEKAELRKIHFHLLRHTYATLRLQKGDDLLDVSKQLGHQDIRTTTKVYFHWMPGKMKSQIAELDLPEAPRGTLWAPKEAGDAVTV
jgi:integrase